MSPDTVTALRLLTYAFAAYACLYALYAAVKTFRDTQRRRDEAKAAEDETYRRTIAAIKAERGEGESS